MSDASFEGRVVVSFESRRAVEMASLIERHGGVAISAPTVREVALGQRGLALAFARTLQEGGFDAVVLMTGVGTRALAEEVAPELDRARFSAALGRASLFARGPKPAAALRALGVTQLTTVTEPNTWREVLAAVAAAGGPLGGVLAGRRIAVVEHGLPSTELYAALTEAGASVQPIAVYRWALPEDTGPLRAALRLIAERGARVALFTSRVQVDNALALAADEGLTEPVREALAAGLVGAIGPVCAEALRAEGLTPDVEPEHPKMGHLVKAAASQVAAVLAAKDGR